MMLNKKFSKVLCTVLAIAMIVTMLPAMALVTSAADDIVVTVGTEGYAEVAGKWAESGLVYPSAPSETGRWSQELDSAVSYMPTIPATGNYKVELYVIPTHATVTSPKNVEVKVVHAAGEEVKTVNFFETSEWVDLGTYKFNAGNAGYVLQTAKEKGAHRAGAVRFTPLSGAAPTPVENTNFSDIEESPYKQEIGLLSAISVLAGYPDGTFHPNDGISRAEMAAIIVRISGLESTVISGETNFTDVPASHWASGYINIASSLGVINGDGDGTFRPDDKVKYNEAVKMLVCVLGYGVDADAKGGWPAGYLVVANELNVSDEVINQAGEASRETVAKLVYNTIDVEYREKTGYGAEATLTTVDGRTLLSEKLKVNKITGTVTETRTTSLFGEGELKNNEVRIDTTKYFTGSTNIADKFGYPVIAYAKFDAKVDKEVSTIVYYEIDEEDLKIIEILNEDLLDADENKITIFEDEEKSTDKINYVVNDDTYIFLNNYIVSGDDSFTLSDLAPVDGDPSFNGKITIIDKGDDEIADTIFVEMTKTLIASGITRTNGGFRLNTENDGTYPKEGGKFDLEDEDIKINIIKDGTPIKYTDIQKYDIISYSKAGNIYTFDVERTVVTGVVEEITYVDGTSKIDEIIVDGKPYKMSTTQAPAPCSVGDTVTFRLDTYGKVAYSSSSVSGADNYAYLVGVGSSTVFDTVYSIEVITMDNERVVLDFAEKISFMYEGKQNEDNAGAPYKANQIDEELLEDYGLIDGSGNVVKQLVKLSKNADNEVTTIETAYDMAGISPKNYTDAQSSMFTMSGLDSRSMAGDGTSFCFAKNGYAGSSQGSVVKNFKWQGVPFLFIPVKTNGEVIEEDIAFAPSVNGLFSSNSSAYPASDYTWYDVTKDGEAGVLIGRFVIDGKDAVDVRGNYMLVKRVATGKVDGETVYNVTGYEVNGKKTVETKIVLEKDTVVLVPSTVTTRADASYIKTGDIINYKTLSNGKNYAVKLMYSSSEFNPSYVTVVRDDVKRFNEATTTIAPGFQSVAVGYYDKYTDDDGMELFRIYINEKLNADTDTSGQYEVSFSDVPNYWRLDTVTGKLEQIDYYDIPLPEEVSADQAGDNGVIPVTDGSGDTKYYKCPKVVLQAGQTGGEDNRFVYSNFIYYDDGRFE